LPQGPAPDGRAENPRRDCRGDPAVGRSACEVPLVFTARGGSLPQGDVVVR